MRLKIFFDIIDETRGILLSDGNLPSLSFSESDNLAETVLKLYKEYVSCDNFFPLTRPLVYQIDGEIVICYRIVLTIFPKWLKLGTIHKVADILQRGPNDETVLVIQSFR